jgi:VWFA-related protein
MEFAKISRRGLLSALTLFPVSRLLRGYEDPQDTTFKAGVKVVNLFATVRDKKGQIVRDLNKEDFLLDEDGRPQTIAYFARETGLPLTIGLLVDTSGSTQNVLPDERSASFRFLRQVLREDKDLVFVIHFDFEVELLQDLTASREKLEKALDLLETGQQRQLSSRGQGPPQYPGGQYPGGGGGNRGGGRRGGGGTLLYDAVLLASDELMKKQTGRKALILLSDGVDTGSKVTLSEAVESAQRADTLVYSILFEDPNTTYAGLGGFGGGMGRRGMGRGGPGAGMNRPDGRKVMEQISRETGGRFFEVSRRQPIDKVFASIEEDLRNQYSLGYTPNQAEAVAGYRRIRLTTRQKGFVVQTREGYYPA